MFAIGYCTLFDEDGTLYGTSSSAKLYKANIVRNDITGRGWRLVLQAQEWPEDVLEDCQEYLENYDDSPDVSTCPVRLPIVVESPTDLTYPQWFVRENSYLLGAAADEDRRGIAEPDEALGTSDKNCKAVSEVDWRRRVSYCPNADWVTIKYTVPLRIVSGSEVLWAPVTWSTMRDELIATSMYFQDDTVVAVHPVYPADTELAQFSTRWPNPYTHVVPNGGAYRLDFTGDITVFSEFGDYNFQLVGTEARNPVDGDDFAVIVNVKFLKPCKLLFYVDGKKVDGATRRNQVTVAKEAGYGFQHATTKVAAFVLKGSTQVSMRALQVVQVTLAIAETFESFFADNLIDPSAIDEEFADMVPPSYLSNYDPNGGNIVRENRFVRNMASVLRIDPSRIKVTNIVPGNRRRRRLQQDRRSLDENDDELDIQWQISEENVDDGTTSNITNTTSAASNSSFVELVAVSETLQEKADSGHCDPGYPVLGMKIIIPEDVCGVPGGNGAYTVSCLGSWMNVVCTGTSCLDECGIANGDGTTCAATAAPSAAVFGDFDECENATSGVGASMRQQIWIRSSSVDPKNSSGFFGTFKLSFNGFVTESISVYASASDVETKLLDLQSVRDSGVSVTGLLVGGAISNTSLSTNGITQLRFGVEFPDTVATGEIVQNLGSLPLLVLDSTSITGDLDDASVHVTCDGAYRRGYEYAEQQVTLTATSGMTLQELEDAGGTLTLKLEPFAGSSCGNGTSNAIKPTDTPDKVVDALQALGEGLFGGIIQDGRIEVFQNATISSSVTWTVRFYTLDSEDLTGCTNYGAMTAMKAIPSTALLNAGANISLEVLANGKVPSTAMPIDLTLSAAEAGAEVAEAEEDLVQAELSAVKDLVVVCGDGVYMSLEGCDDGNLADGDGCDKNCTIESGYVCSKEISYKSVCTIPQDATIQFLNGVSSFPGIPEGNKTTISVERIGENSSACNVSNSVRGVS